MIRMPDTAENGGCAMRLGSLALILFASFSVTGPAQVPGMCVSGCNIPNPPQQPQAPQLDPRLILTGFAVMVRGDVTFIYPNGERIKGSTQTPIVYGTRVETGPDAKVQFILLDETSFTIGPNSEMVLDDFVYDPRTDIKRVSARVARGTFRFISGKVARKDPENLRIRTNVITIGIRGTDLEINVDPFGSGTVILHEGEIEVEEHDSGKPFIMRAGQTLRYEDFKIVSVQ
jgi:hypothetical protein